MKRAILYGLCLVFIFLSANCAPSEKVSGYMDFQANPFVFSKHIKYGFFSKLENELRHIYFGCQFFRDELSYLINDSGYTANLNIHIALNKSEFNTQWDTIFSFKKHYVTYDSTRLEIPEKIFIRLPVPPGDYEFYCNLSDTHSPGDIQIYSSISAPGSDDSLLLSSVRIIESQTNKDISLTKQLSFNSGLKPSLEFDVIYHNNKNARVQLVLSKAMSDTSSARTFYAMNTFQGSLEARGYKSEDTEWEHLAIDTQLITGVNEITTFSYLLPDSLKEGMYTAKVKIITEKEIRVSPEELFYIFPDYFPEIKTFDEALKILRYIAAPYEYDDIISAENDSLIKENFERFWLKISDWNPDVAKKKIARFYQRAAEANILFSNYKPGWKTDLGMTYILLGRPEETNWSPSSLVWYYYYDESTSNIPLQFLPIRHENNIIGYYLVRHIAYEKFWYEYRRRWEGDYSY